MRQSQRHGTYDICASSAAELRGACSVLTERVERQNLRHASDGTGREVRDEGQSYEYVSHLAAAIAAAWEAAGVRFLSGTAILEGVFDL